MIREGMLCCDVDKGCKGCKGCKRVQGVQSISRAWGRRKGVSRLLLIPHELNKRFQEVIHSGKDMVLSSLLLSPALLRA